MLISLLFATASIVPEIPSGVGVTFSKWLTVESLLLLLLSYTIYMQDFFAEWNCLTWEKKKEGKGTKHTSLKHFSFGHNYKIKEDKCFLVEQFYYLISVINHSQDHCVGILSPNFQIRPSQSIPERSAYSQHRRFFQAALHWSASFLWTY